MAGYPRTSVSRTSFYRNKGSGQFENYTEQYNLIDFRTTSAFNYVDFDRDGDVDVAAVPATGPVQFFVNDINKSHGFAVELRNHVANRIGAGSKVIIRYGSGQHQVREIQRSGGFLSFNEPVAHFGLGETDRVDSIEVQWSSGESSVIEGPFDARGRYVIERRVPALAAN